MKHRNAGGCPELGSRIRELREKKKQTLQQVAKGASTTKSHIWAMEQGQSPNPTIGLVLALARHFKVNINRLVRP